MAYPLFPQTRYSPTPRTPVQKLRHFRCRAVLPARARSTIRAARASGAIRRSMRQPSGVPLRPPMRCWRRPHSRARPPRRPHRPVRTRLNLRLRRSRTRFSLRRQHSVTRRPPPFRRRRSPHRARSAARASQPISHRRRQSAQRRRLPGNSRRCRRPAQLRHPALQASLARPRTITHRPEASVSIRRQPI